MCVCVLFDLSPSRFLFTCVGRWDCPWHHCDVCGKNSEAFCQLCPNSFCKAHQEGALRPWPLTGQLCCMEHEEPNGTEDVAAGPQTQVVVASEAAATSSAAASRPSKGKKNSRAAEAKAAASPGPAKRLAKGSRKKQGKGKTKAQTAL